VTAGGSPTVRPPPGRGPRPPVTPGVDRVMTSYAGTCPERCPGMIGNNLRRRDTSQAYCRCQAIPGSMPAYARRDRYRRLAHLSEFAWWRQSVVRERSRSMRSGTASRRLPFWRKGFGYSVRFSLTVGAEEKVLGFASCPLFPEPPHPPP